MARGWESKAVEDQIAEADAERQMRAKLVLTADERELHERREALLMSRTRILDTLETARDERYRAHLTLALADLERQLEALPT